MPAIALKEKPSPQPATSRPCEECHGALLLISVMPAKVGQLSRLYQCMSFANKFGSHADGLALDALA